MFEIAEQEVKNTGAKIKVIGVGGGGCNAVNTMIRAGLSGVEYIVANTDVQALQINLADKKIQLGAEITKGLGAGANPEIGRKAALEDYEKLSEILTGADMVFVTAGMGGGTGTGAAPIIAKLSRELGALTVGVVTKPFAFEGKKRSRQALEGIQDLENCVDSLITIPNQRLLLLAGESLSLVETFKKADEVLLHAVQGISDLINNTGLINADFADVSTVMKAKGMALMGTGMASGENRAIKAANEAISSPLLEDITIDGATGIIINISGNSTLTTHEANEAMTLVMEAADEDAEIIFGTVIDENMGEEIKVTVIATGLGTNELTISSNQANKVSSNGIESKDPEILTQETTKEFDSETEIEAKTENQASSGSNYSEAESNNNYSSDSNKETLSNTDLEVAAKRYQQAKDGKSNAPDVSNISEFPTGEHASANEEKVDTGRELSSRTKSIAEKLGFLNFDEDEFDRPSFLRKDAPKELSDI